MIFALSGCGYLAEKKKIAISIDDAPVMRFHSHGSHDERIALIDSLADALDRLQSACKIDCTNNLIRPAARAYGEDIRYFRFLFLAEGSTRAEKDHWREELGQRHEKCAGKH